MSVPTCECAYLYVMSDAWYVTATLLNSESALGIMLPTGKKTRFAVVLMRRM